MTSVISIQVLLSLNLLLFHCLKGSIKAICSNCIQPQQSQTGWWKISLDFFMGWSLVLCFFPHLVIRDCGSYRKFQRDFGVHDSSPNKIMYCFWDLRMLEIKMSVCRPSMMVVQQSKVCYWKCIVTIRNVYMDDKTVCLDFFFFLISSS